MGRDWKKRMGCILLAVILTVSNVQPVFATAVEDNGTGLCDHHMVHENCGYVEGEENSCTYSCALCIAEEKAIADQAAADAVSMQIAALPTVDAVKEMAMEAQLSAYEQTQEAYTAYNALTEEQKALLPLAEEVFKPLFDYFNSLTAEAMDVTDSFAIAGSCGDLTWELDENGTLTISGEGAIPDYFVQEAQNPPWYEFRTNIKEVSLSQTVTSIGEDAFADCENMTTVTIPDGVTKIGRAAFESCSSLSSITIPNSVTSIGAHAFFGCSLLQEIVIPNSVEELDVWVFSGCSGLTSVKLPDNLGSIPTGTFHDCSSLTGISIPNSVSYIADSAFNGCSSIREITLPEISWIDYRSFYGCNNLTSITIPQSVIEIGAQAFSGCTGLTDIKFEGDAPVFGENEGIKAQFEGITATIYYPSGNETWTEAVRQNYGGTVTWTAENTGESGTDEPDGTFVGGTCGNLNWELEDGVLTIAGNGAMPDYSWTEAPWYDHAIDILSVVISDGVTTIGNSAFYRCRFISEVVIADSVTRVGDSAFWECKSLKAISLPDSIITLEDRAFTACSGLESITLSDRITSLGEDVFARCEKLISITIPENVTKLESGAFSGCSDLEEIRFLGSAPEIATDSFDGVTATAYYPEGNETWTEEVRQSYGGTITWVAYDPNGSQSNYIFYPENGATEVGTVSASGEKVGIDKLTITFDMKIKKNSDSDSRALLDFTAGTIAIYRKDDDTLVWKAEEDTFTLGTAGTEVCVDTAQTTLVIEPVNRNNMFDFDAEYYVVVDAGVVSFEDNSTNKAITRGSWEFTMLSESSKTCTLEELTSVDLLAMADLCYSSLPGADKFGEMTIREMIGEDKWEKKWKSTDIKNAELFANVASWIVYDAIENDSTGFAAYTFKNNNDEFVVAYRGSEPLEDWALNDPDYVADWIYQNANAFFGGVGTQLLEAIWYPKEIVNTYGTDSVVITGHSLGGALCDIVSARYGCRAESFNAAPFLANAYIHLPDEMGYLFSGRENWLFKDHITDGDFVGENKLWMKNYNVHEHSGYQVGTHSLASLIAKNAISNELGLTSVLKENMYIESPLVDNGLYLGTFDSNTLFYQDIGSDYVIYTGGGSDTIYADRKSDTIVGGKGSDVLDGGQGRDYYFYYKNDGEDWIYDLSGRDILYLMGFSDTDSFSFVTDRSFLNIQCNGKEIIHIQRNRAYNILSSFEVITHYETNPKSTNIAQYLTTKKYTGRYKIACPVSVEIIDDTTGDVIHTMINGESGVGAAYTDYGYFYVYQNESGEYVKVADLFEGYSLRIVGEDEGTMDVSVYEVTEDGLAEPVSLTDVPVTSKLSATIEKKNDGKLYLIVDSDSDDETDKEIPFDGASTDDDTTGGDSSDDETPDDEAADIDDILAQLDGMTSQNVVPGDKTKLLSIMGSIEILLAEEGLTEEQRQLLTTAKEKGEMLLAAIAALETAAKNVSDLIANLPATVEPDDEDAVAKIMAAKKAYDELDARAKALISTELKTKLDTLVKATTDYKIIKGNNSKWIKNSGRNLAFTVNAPFSKFESVEVDGKTIAESNYTSKSGSTIITLKSSFLQTLSAGEHTITVVFTDNEASGIFTIQKATSSPFTGDTFHLTLWISVMVVAGASLVVLLYKKRKQK